MTAQSRLQSEMGFSCQLYSVGLFYYKANVNVSMIKHEIDRLFVRVDTPKVIQSNPQEVQEYQWVDVGRLLTFFNVVHLYYAQLKERSIIQLNSKEHVAYEVGISLCV